MIYAISGLQGRRKGGAEAVSIDATAARHAKHQTGKSTSWIAACANHPQGALVSIAGSASGTATIARHALATVARHYCHRSSGLKIKAHHSAQLVTAIITVAISAKNNNDAYLRLTKP